MQLQIHGKTIRTEHIQSIVRNARGADRKALREAAAYVAACTTDRALGEAARRVLDLIGA